MKVNSYGHFNHGVDTKNKYSNSVSGILFFSHASSMDLPRLVLPRVTIYIFLVVNRDTPASKVKKNKKIYIYMYRFYLLFLDMGP